MSVLLYYQISSYPHPLQYDLNIDGQVIYFCEMVCEGTYFPPITINYHYLVFLDQLFHIYEFPP